MKNKSTLVNVIFGVALVVLYILHFTSGGSAEVVDTETEESVEDTAVAAVDTTSMLDTIDLSIGKTQALSFPIAYVDIDRFSAEYQYMIDETKNMERRLRNLQSRFQSKAKEFQEAGGKLQQDFEAGLITQQEAQNKMMELQTQAMESEKKFAQEEQFLREREAKIIQEVSNNITEFLESQKNDLKYSYVVMRGPGSSVLYANDSLNITDKLLGALNLKYAESKK